MKKSPSETSVQPLLDYFDELIPLSPEDRDLVTDKFHSRLCRKKQDVLQEGDICNQFNFVVRGCLRTYKIDEKGNTHRVFGDLHEFGGLGKTTTLAEIRKMA